MDCLPCVKKKNLAALHNDMFWSRDSESGSGVGLVSAGGTGLLVSQVYLSTLSCKTSKKILCCIWLVNGEGLEGKFGGERRQVPGIKQDQSRRKGRGVHWEV